MRLAKVHKQVKDYYTIGEISGVLDVDQHVVRFWSNQFPNFIKPIRTAGQRRSYTNKDLETLKLIKDLLYKKGMSIKGAQQILKDKKSLDALWGIQKPLKKLDVAKIDSLLDKLESMSSIIESKIVEEFN